MKNIITSKLNDYNQNISILSNSEDLEIKDYKNKKATFIKDIVEAFKIINKSDDEIQFPKQVKGYTLNGKNGFVFTREPKYNNVDIKNEFYKQMFVKSYQNIEKVLQIDTNTKFAEAVKGCSSSGKINDQWDKNFDGFIEKSKDYTEHILEETSNSSIGNTLGEVSLVYYKYQTYDTNNLEVLLIDQPEDNISNKKIGDELISYFNTIRNSMQLIIVTHNPLLVVNLDADNVIHTLMKNNNLIIKSGCLEDEENKILDIVAETLEGGKEMIERRIKVYG